MMMCHCADRTLHVDHIGYDRGCGQVDFYCAECAGFVQTRALDDLPPALRRLVLRKLGIR
jgi:hypothetical protein